MNRTTETIGDATGETGWRKTYARKWTPPAQSCGAWRRKVEQTPEQVMRSALDAFGTRRQVDKCLGEMHELGEVLLSHRYGEASAAQVIDEIADGFVVLGQMRLLYGPEAVDERIKVKLARLVRLVADQVQAKAQENPFRELVRDPKPGETKCGSCMWWGAQGLRDPVGVCMHKDRASRDRGYMAAADCSLPAPKPVKPALRWEATGDDLTLYDGEAVGWVSWWPESGKWMGNPYGETAMPCGDKADAMRHVEMACGFDEVPLWTP